MKKELFCLPSYASNWEKNEEKNGFTTSLG